MFNLKVQGCSQVYSVGVQVHTDHIRWGIVEVKVSRVNAHNEGTWCIEDPRQRQRAKRDIRTLPLEWEDHLKGDNDNGVPFINITNPLTIFIPF